MGYLGNNPYQGVLTGGSIQDGTVDTADLAPGAITTTKLEDNSVTASKIAAGAGLPSQTSQSGKFLKSNGTSAEWTTLDLASLGITNHNQIVVDANGKLLVGQTSSINNGQLSVYAPSGNQAITAKVGNDGNSLFQGFNSSGSLAAQITGGGDLLLQDSTPSIKLQESSASQKRLELTIDANAVARIKANQSSSEIAFETTGTERVRVDKVGKVGLGTTDPLDLLHLNSNTTDARILIDGHTGYDAEVKYASGGVVKYTTGYDAATDSFVIGTTNVDTQRKLVISSTGNVGIGNTAPEAELHICNDTADTSGTLSLSGTGGASYIKMGNKDSGATAGPVVIVSANRSLQFGHGDSHTSRSGGNFTSRMIIKDDGNVGIGTGSPAAKLHVSGTIRSDAGLINDGYIYNWSHAGVGNWRNLFKISASSDKSVWAIAKFIIMENSAASFVDVHLSANIRHNGTPHSDFYGTTETWHDIQYAASSNVVTVELSNQGVTNGDLYLRIKNSTYGMGIYCYSIEGIGSTHLTKV